MEWKYKNVKQVPVGPHTPWPNRAETAVKLFGIALKQIAYTLYQTEFTRRHFLTARMVILRACWARNNALTYGGKTPLEIAYGRRPPDVLDPENESFGSLSERAQCQGYGPGGNDSKGNGAKNEFGPDGAPDAWKFDNQVVTSDVFLPETMNNFNICFHPIKNATK